MPCRLNNSLDTQEERTSEVKQIIVLQEMTWKSLLRHKELEKMKIS